MISWLVLVSMPCLPAGHPWLLVVFNPVLSSVRTDLIQRDELFRTVFVLLFFLKLGFANLSRHVKFRRWHVFFVGVLLVLVWWFRIWDVKRLRQIFKNTKIPSFTYIDVPPPIHIASTWLLMQWKRNELFYWFRTVPGYLMLPERCHGGFRDNSISEVWI